MSGKKHCLCGTASDWCSKPVLSTATEQATKVGDRVTENLSGALLKSIKCTEKFSSDVWELHLPMGRDGNLEWRLIPYLFSKNSGRRLTPGAWKLPYHGVLVKQSTRYVLPPSGLKSKKRSVGYPYNICTTIAPMNTSCHAGCYWSSQCSQLGNIIDVFYSQTSYMTTSRTMKASQEVRTSW